MPSKAERDALRDALRPEAKKKKLIPLVGSRVSREARLGQNKCADFFPSWRELVEKILLEAEEKQLIDKAQIVELWEGLRRDDFTWVAETLRFDLPTVIYEGMLAKHYSPPRAKHAEIHQQLLRLGAPLILTTNYDTLLEDAYAQLEGEAADVYTYRQTDLVSKVMDERWGRPGTDRLRSTMLGAGWSGAAQSGAAGAAARPAEDDRPLIYKIFGTIRQPFDMILTPRRFRKNFQQEKNLPAEFLSSLFINNSVIMFGFSAADVELNELLKMLSDYVDYNIAPDYIFLTDVDADREKASTFEKRYKIKPVDFGSTEEVMEFVGELI